MAAPKLASIDSLKVPPHSLEAEQAVLGGLLLSARAFEQVADLLGEDDFYREDHRLIFRSVSELNELGNPVDAVTVTEWFEAHGVSDQVDGGAYVMQLASTTPSAANVTAYAQIVREKSILRQLIDVGTEIASSAFQSDGRTSQELLEDAERAVFAIADLGARNRSGFIAVQETIKEAIERIQELNEFDGEITGVATGFRDFDRMTAGLQPSDLIIVAGRPSMGKTTLAMNFAEHAALKHDVPVAVFSMEMSALQLVMRLFSSLGQIEQGRLRTGNLTDLDWPKLTSAMNLLHKSRIFVDETPALSPAELRARARRLKREHDIGMIVVDYLQLMAVPGSRDNRATEIAEISRSLKSVAKELNVPVVALSQLNRSLEQRPNKRPVMADLRESGSIEQDADLIVFIYRDEVYNPETAEKGKAEIIIGKHRNGETGTVNLTWQGRWLRFANFAPEYFYDEHGE
ncbi:replicative DNA helicase [Elongatibacter sediminis]|uniref:Replicative DNA helicase n=1 Tax=Elongatibacter sediminis TaxID=3119006 RepID=A0AAW9RBV1_9GAMM